MKSNTQRNKASSLRPDETDYQRIRTDVEAAFPQWKKDLCNDVLLTSKHSEKL